MKVIKEKILSLNDPKLKETQQIFDGHILQVYVNDLEIEPGVVVQREIIHHQPAVCILATHDNKVFLVKQFRPAINQEIFEVPAGILDYQGNTYEDPLEGAKRELEEETGYQAASWAELQTFFVSPGYLDEAITLFHARDLSKVENPLSQDEHENVTLYKFNRDQIKEMMTNGTIVDIKTLFALQYWLSLGEG